MNENKALELLGRLLPGAPPGEVWWGDDAAVLAVPSGGRQLLLALDTVVDGVDADLSLTKLSDFGWKAMAVNLSDVAAMGGTPAHALVSVTGLGAKSLTDLYEGVLEASARYGCPVVGGDLSSGEQLVVSVVVSGWSEDHAVLRSGAHPGDTIWVTAPLGAAAAGLRCLRERAASGGAGGAKQLTPEQEALVRAHARPVPALAEGVVAKKVGATAMIDVSDGLVSDLSRLARSSGVGFELAEVPVAPGATLLEALGGGDDYALVFTLPPSVRPEPAFEAVGLPAPAPLGACVADTGRHHLGGAALAVPGWEHAL